MPKSSDQLRQSQGRAVANLIDRMFERSVTGVERALDLTWQRNKAITSNIANAETPQYRAKEINFSNALEKAFNSDASSMKLTNPGHLDSKSNDGAPKVEQDLSGMTKPDGNNVDIDLQMGKLAYNAGKFSMATNLIRKQLQIYRNAIRDAGR